MTTFEITFLVLFLHSIAKSHKLILCSLRGAKISQIWSQLLQFLVVFQKNPGSKVLSNSQGENQDIAYF